MANAPWLFSPAVDFAAFGLPVIGAFGLVLMQPFLQGPPDDTPEWAWLAIVLAVDVAHVWGTLFRVYTQPSELRRRPTLYGGVPAVCFLAAVMLYDMGFLVFWRAVAYLATWHFVRQQIGWVRLYGRREGRRAPWHAWLDQAAIYAATLYPLVWWHTHLPRRFAWMLQGDYMALPAGVCPIAAGLFTAVFTAYAARMAWQRWSGRTCLGKDMVVWGTLACWYGGIVLCDSDYIFTVTNVLIHGVPYMVLIHVYRRHQARSVPKANFTRYGLAALLAALWTLAYLEELLWDHALWHERTWLFGAGWNLEAWEAWLVPALAVPQLTHYVLDGFVWRGFNNPTLQGLFASRPGRAL